MEKALEKMDDDANDEYAVFGKFMANEIKSIPDKRDQESLKRKIQRVVLDFKEQLDMRLYRSVYTQPSQQQTQQTSSEFDFLSMTDTEYTNLN